MHLEDKRRKDGEEFSKWFMEKYSVSFLEICLKVLNGQKEEYVGKKVLNYAIKYVCHAL